MEPPEMVAVPRWVLFEEIYSHEEIHLIALVCAHVTETLITGQRMAVVSVETLSALSGINPENLIFMLDTLQANRVFMILREGGKWDLDGGLQNENVFIISEACPWVPDFLPPDWHLLGCPEGRHKFGHDLKCINCGEHRCFLYGHEYIEDTEWASCCACCGEGT